MGSELEESGMASASFANMVTPEGELLVLRNFGEYQVFSVPSQENILKYSVLGPGAFIASGP